MKKPPGHRPRRSAPEKSHWQPPLEASRASPRAPRRPENADNAAAECIEPFSSIHSHLDHSSIRGLGQHLKLYFRHDWGEDLVKRYGFDLVVEVLDELTELYGALLDAPPLGARSPSGFVQSSPEPEIRRPAAKITAQVKIRYERRSQARSPLRSLGEVNLPPTSEGGGIS